jgi:hypothetical protein
MGERDFAGCRAVTHAVPLHSRNRRDAIALRYTRIQYGSRKDVLP